MPSDPIGDLSPSALAARLVESSAESVRALSAATVMADALDAARGAATP